MLSAFTRSYFNWTTRKQKKTIGGEGMKTHCLLLAQTQPNHTQNTKRLEKTCTQKPERQKKRKSHCQTKKKNKSRKETEQEKLQERFLFKYFSFSSFLFASPFLLFFFLSLSPLLSLFGCASFFSPSLSSSVSACFFFL